MLVNWTLLTYFVVGVFALSGFSRGWWKEALTTGLLAVLILLLQQPAIAKAMIDLINAIVSYVWMLAPNFLSAFFNNILTVKTTATQPFQFNAGDPSIWIMMLMVLVFATHVTGRSMLPNAPTSAGSALGALVGGFNGFVMLNLVREYVSGSALPTHGQMAMAGGRSVASSGVSIQATQLPNFTIMDSLIPWVLIIIGLLVFITAVNHKAKVKLSDKGFVKIDYRKPYGYK